MFADEREVKTVLPAVHRGGKREYTSTFEVKERQELMLEVEPETARSRLIWKRKGGLAGISWGSHHEIHEI